jgi:carbamoyltransferase
MIIIGISAFYHDAAACIIRDGNIVAAAQEERFSRKKHDSSFPIESIKFCMSQAGISANDIDFFVFYEKPILKFKRLLSTYVATMPYGFRNFYA